jgi:hypothetical protein
MNIIGKKFINVEAIPHRGSLVEKTQRKECSKMSRIRRKIPKNRRFFMGLNKATQCLLVSDV